MRHLPIFLVSFLAPLTVLAQDNQDAKAEAPATLSPGKSDCSMGKLTRSVTLESGADNKGCKVDYAKEDGSTKTIWSSQRDPNYCGDKAKGFIQKLEGQGWTCSGSIGK